MLKSVLKKIADKLIFGIMLLLFLQVPLLVDQYIHYMNGHFKATLSQVQDLRKLVNKYHYTTVHALILDFKRDENPAIREDGMQKEQLMIKYDKLLDAMNTLHRGYYIEKLLLVFNPSRFNILIEVLKNFSLGLPLSLVSFSICFFSALVVHLFCPFAANSSVKGGQTCIAKMKDIKKSKKKKNETENAE